MNLDGKIALVTGGAQGIGFGIAQVLRQNGARVVIGDVRLDAAEKAAAELGNGAFAVGFDVRRAAQIEAAFDEIEAKAGPVDILVNNAGVLTMAPALELSEEDWDFLMDVNAKGVFLCSQVAGRRMVRRGKGRIINLGSIASKVPLVDQVHYCASKHAVLAITRVFAVELAKQGVTVNAICPGAIDTELFKDCYTFAANKAGVTPESVRDMWLGPVAIGRLIQPSEIGELAAFLASDAASAITGQAYNIDGGNIWY